MLLAQSVLSEAHAKQYLKECQGIELQKVQVLAPTTPIMNLYGNVELIELHPSDNREELLQQEGIHMRNVRTTSLLSTFPPKGRSR